MRAKAQRIIYRVETPESKRELFKVVGRDQALLALARGTLIRLARAASKDDQEGVTFLFGRPAEVIIEWFGFDKSYRVAFPGGVNSKGEQQDWQSCMVSLAEEALYQGEKYLGGQGPF